METVIVSAAWMKACGIGTEDTKMKVIEVSHTLSRDQFFGAIYTVRRPDGTIWKVAQGRLV